MKKVRTDRKSVSLSTIAASLPRASIMRSSLYALKNKLNLVKGVGNKNIITREIVASFI